VIVGAAVVSTGGDGDVRVEAEVPGKPSGLGWLPGGRLLVVSTRDRTVLRREESGELVEHADLSAHATGHANDMVVDADGRAYVGNFGFDLMGGAGPAPAALVRVDPDGTVAPSSSAPRPRSRSTSGVTPGRPACSPSRSTCRPPCPQAEGVDGHRHEQGRRVLPAGAGMVPAVVAWTVSRGHPEAEANTERDDGVTAGPLAQRCRPDDRGRGNLLARTPRREGRGRDSTR